MIRTILTLLLLSALGTTPSQAGPIQLELTTGIPAQDVYVAADFTDWKKWRMKENAPGRYGYSFEEPWLPELRYKFVVNGQWMADPTNPLSAPDGFGGVNSVLRAKEFKEDPLLTPQPGSAPWVESRLVLRDFEADSRTITILSPPHGPPSVTIYFQDGGDYLTNAGARALLSNLSREPGMPLLTGVFIPPKERGREYRLLASYADWVAKEVVPQVEGRFSTGGDRTRRLLIGPSLGGLITLYTALRHRQVFGYAASQSGSLWFERGVLLKSLGAQVSSPSERLKIFMDCGSYESDSMLSFNRQGFEAARSAGHEVTYREYPSIHDWIGWRNRLSETLRYFFATPRAPL